MKRYRAAGSPDAYGDWIVCVLPLPTDDEAGFAFALHALVTATQDLDAFLALPSGEQAHHYTLRFVGHGSGDPLLHERDFWPRAVRFPALRPLIEQYIRQVNTGGMGNCWQDEFHPRGSFAVAELALADPAACVLLGALLFQWDMTYETYQRALIDQLVARYGAVEPIWDLFACRVLADGQCIEEQIAEILYGRGFHARLDLADFAQRCAKYVGQSTCPDLGLQYFAMVYANGDEAQYDAVWAAVHAAGIDEPPEGFDAEESWALAAAPAASYAAHWNAACLDISVDAFAFSALALLPATA